MALLLTFDTYDQTNKMKEKTKTKTNKVTDKDKYNDSDKYNNEETYEGDVKAAGLLLNLTSPEPEHHQLPLALTQEIVPDKKGLKFQFGIR